MITFNNLQRRSGFTLIEIAVVLTCLAFLSFLGCDDGSSRANRSTAKTATTKNAGQGVAPSMNFWDWARSQDEFKDFISASNNVAKCKAKLRTNLDEEMVRSFQRRQDEEQRKMSRAFATLKSRFAEEQFKQVRQFIKDNRAETEDHARLEDIVKAVEDKSEELLKKTKTEFERGEM